jgi:hypothetical protein
MAREGGSRGRHARHLPDRQRQPEAITYRCLVSTQGAIAVSIRTPHRSGRAVQQRAVARMGEKGSHRYQHTVVPQRTLLPAGAVSR